MIRDLVAAKTSEIHAACKAHRVRRLLLFGSILREDFRGDRSDVDFLVEFDPADQMNPADQYFGLWEALKDLFGRDVDLVTVRSLRNPYFIRSVNATREPVYAS